MRYAHWLANRPTKTQTGKVTHLFTAYDGNYPLCDRCCWNIQNLGLRDGIVRIYNENAATNNVYAEIKGFWASDRTSADGKYLIIGNEGKEFIVTDGRGVYKTGAQIITSKVTTTVGEAATTEIRNLTFNDEDAIAPLQELRNVYPNADIYLTGQLTVDFPEDVKIPIESNQMATAALSGSSLKFNYCGLSRAIALLREQYAVGTVEIRIVQLRAKSN